MTSVHVVLDIAPSTQSNGFSSLPRTFKILSGRTSHKPLALNSPVLCYWYTYFPHWIMKSREAGPGFNIFKQFLLYTFISVWVHLWGHACHSMHVEIRGQLAGVDPFLLPCQSWGLNSGHTHTLCRPLIQEDHIYFILYLPVNSPPH